MRKKIFLYFILFSQLFLFSSNAQQNKNPILQKIYKYSLKCFPPSLKSFFPKKTNFSFPTNNYKTKEAIINRLKFLCKKQIADLKGFPSFKILIKRYLEMEDLITKLNDLTIYAPKNSKNFKYMVDFKKFTKMKFKKFIPVFYGYSEILFKNGDIDYFLNSICKRNKKLYERILKEYLKGGNSSNFDERSAAFGIASILFSKTITDYTNLVLYTWWISNGDTTDTPYFNFKNPYLKIYSEKGERDAKN